MSFNISILRIGIILVVGSIFNSCSKDQHSPVLAINPEFHPYIERFERVASEVGTAVSITDLTIEFGKPSTSSETGTCTWNEESTPKITINPETWEKRNSDVEHQLIIFHELGHCILKRNHETNFIQNPSLNDSVWEKPSRPSSIMHPSLLDEQIYTDDIDYYNQELFDPSKRNEY